MTRILVVGDVMLDHYIYGRADRISPEAPIPILSWEREEYRLGGAGSVASMCRALGADVTIASVLGDDEPGERVAAMLHGHGIESLARHDYRRVTTTKTRIVGIAQGRHFQQLQRIDHETPVPFDGDLPGISGRYDCVIVSDYDKGFCIPQTILGLQRFGPVIVDPPKKGNWRKKYVGMAGCFVPNRAESGGPQTIEDARRFAAEMQETLTAQAVVVKLDADGCVLATRESSLAMPTVAREVIDVCGAGDQFVATLGVSRARGMSWDESCQLANKAAGLQCGRFGCDPIPGDDIWEPSGQTAVSTDSITGISHSSRKPVLKVSS